MERGKRGGVLGWPPPEQEPEHLDLNIDRMRSKILAEMHTAMRPYQERLKELDVVEAVLKREQAAVHAKNGWEKRRKAHVSDITPDRPEPRPRALPAILGPYRDMTQRQAVVEILKKEPGLLTGAITDRMIKGGYPFTAPKPVTSMTSGIRQMVLAGIVRSEIEDDGFHYYLIGSESATEIEKEEEPSPVVESLEDKPMTEAVLHVLYDGPKLGLTRFQVHDQLVRRGFQFGTTSRHPPQRQVTWTLQSLIEHGKIQRTGSKAAAMFTIVRPPKFNVSPHK